MSFFSKRKGILPIVVALVFIVLTIGVILLSAVIIGDRTGVGSGKDDVVSDSDTTTDEDAPTGPIESTGKWIWPARGRITCEFGCVGRMHKKPHSGLDIAVVNGTSIKAADGGRIVRINTNPSNICGIYVTIQHEGGLQSIYCHMISGSPTVSVGDSVTQGQIIGRSDNTGRSSGPHLHFGAKLNGKNVNPRNYLQ